MATTNFPFLTTMAGSVSEKTMNTPHSYQVLLTNFQTALCNSLCERCVFLTQLLQDSPLKELQYVFPTLIENIFGFRTGADWGFLSLEKEVHYREFEVLRSFMSPNGPILKLVYKFTEDISPKFEFPISCLPGPSQMMLHEGKMPPLYANKLQILNPGLFPSVVQLNAFEFYFFHFAYFIVNPNLKTSSCTVNQQEALYAHILEDYLHFFLPTEGRAIPLYQASSSMQQSPIMTSSLSPNFGKLNASSDHLSRSHLRPDFLSPVNQKPSLFKKDTMLMVASSTPSNSSCGLSSSLAESWRSESFLLILREMYLNQTSLDQQNTLDLITKAYVSSHYHVWMVRLLVKHLHFFFNSSFSAGQTSGHGQIMIDSFGRLKSIGMTQFMQKEMYCFLKSTFDHWPLDSSFRVPLETWLSYIQPWRYCRGDLDGSFLQKYTNENILFYSTMFQQVLRRFLRMDLSCPKNAYMLFRLTKVFSIGGLREMIMQAEKSCVSKPSSLEVSSYIQRSPEKSFSFRKLSHLEVPGTGYVPLFSEPVFMMVTHLLSSISAALEKRNLDTNGDVGNKSFFSKVCSFLDTSNDAYNSDDNSPADMKKLSQHLETSADQLCQFFREVSRPALCTSVNTTSAKSSASIMTSENMTESRVHDLSTFERIQLLNKKKKPKVTYQGNPDLQPVRTYEIAVLVKLFNEVSQLLNDKYASEIQQLYNNPRLLGKVFRRILAKPVVYHNVIKSSDMQSVTWNPVTLPPRINLRFLAQKQIICYFFMLMIFNWWAGYNPVLMLMFLLLLTMFFILVSAFIYPVPIGIKND